MDSIQWPRVRFSAWCFHFSRRCCHEIHQQPKLLRVTVDSVKGFKKLIKSIQNSQEASKQCKKALFKFSQWLKSFPLKLFCNVKYLLSRALSSPLQTQNCFFHHIFSEVGGKLKLKLKQPQQQLTLLMTFLQLIIIGCATCEHTRTCFRLGRWALQKMKNIYKFKWRQLLRLPS